MQRAGLGVTESDSRGPLRPLVIIENLTQITLLTCSVPLNPPSAPRIRYQALQMGPR